MSVRNGEGVPEGYNLGAVAGRAFERERIIALLEEEYALAVKYDFEIVHGLYAAIALIKGEEA